MGSCGNYIIFVPTAEMAFWMNRIAEGVYNDGTATKEIKME